MNIKTKENYIFTLLMLISVLLMSGCKSQNASVDKAAEANAYTYKEVIYNQLLSIESISSACINSAGEIIFYDDNGRIVHADNTGRIIKEIKKSLNGEICFAIDANDNVYALQNYLKKDDKGQVHALVTELIAYDSAGNELKDRYAINEKKGSWEDIKDEVARKIQVNSKGSIYVLKYDSTVEVFDFKLQSINTLGIDEYRDIAIDENDNLIAVPRKGAGENQLLKIDTVSLKTIWEGEYSHSDYIHYNAKTKFLYGISNGIIMKYDMTNNKATELLNINEFTKTDGIYGIFVDSGENVYTLANDEGKNELASYIKEEENKESSEQIEITISAYWPDNNYSNSALLNIARKFEREHPDVKINFQVYDHLINIETGHKNYIEKLNSELLASKGPDILLGYYPALEYANKGILVNLHKIMEKDSSFNIDDYSETIINASIYKDGLYIMPLSYACRFIIGNKELMNEKNIDITQWTWKDFSDLLDKADDNEKDEKIYAFPQSYFYDRILFKNIILQDIDYYIDWDKREARANTKDFTELLDMFKQIMDKNCYHPQLKASYGGRDRDAFMESILFIPEYTGCYWNFNTMGQKFDSIRILPLPKGEKTNTRLFMSYNASILEGSKQKDLAWKFIKYILNEDNQFFLSEYQFVMNKKAEEERIKLFFEQQEDDDIKRVTESEMNNIITIKNSLNKNDAFVPADEFFNMIWAEVEPFLKNYKSAEEIAEIIQNKVQLYLNE